MKTCINIKCLEFNRHAWLTDSFCPSCGSKLGFKNDLKCPKCRAIHLEHQDYCPNCGYSFKENKDPLKDKMVEKEKPWWQKWFF